MKDRYLHVHEVVITQFQVGLGKTNLHWHNGSLLESGTAHPISALDSSLLMEDMLDRGRSSIAESSQAQNG